jgi:hypothetical protein
MRETLPVKPTSDISSVCPTGLKVIFGDKLASIVVVKVNWSAMLGCPPADPGVALSLPAARSSKITRLRKVLTSVNDANVTRDGTYVICLNYMIVAVSYTLRARMTKLSHEPLERIRNSEGSRSFFLPRSASALNPRVNFGAQPPSASIIVPMSFSSFIVRSKL